MERLIVDTVAAGGEEIEREEGEESQLRTNRKAKGRKGQRPPTAHQTKDGRKGQRPPTAHQTKEGRRPLAERQGERQQEERWQEVSAAFNLTFPVTDSSAALVSGIGLYDFSELYGLDWALLTGLCRFLCMSFPPSSLLHPRLRSDVQRGLYLDGTSRR